MNVFQYFEAFQVVRELEREFHSGELSDEDAGRLTDALEVITDYDKATDAERFRVLVNQSSNPELSGLLGMINDVAFDVIGYMETHHGSPQQHESVMQAED